MLLTLDGLASVVEILEDGSSAPRLYGPREVQDPPPDSPALLPFCHRRQVDPCVMAADGKLSQGRSCPRSKGTQQRCRQSTCSASKIQDMHQQT